MKNGIINALTRLLILSFILGGLSITQAAVWKDENTWNAKWEQRFQEWVKLEWHMYMFTDPSYPIYYGLETDCADASYDMRLIFAYQHKLPFVILEPGAPHRKISNKMNKWDKYSEEKKVRHFIDYINDITDTNTLQHDTYPVLLKALSAGDIYVSPGSHSYQIVEISETGVPITISSSTPKKNRPLYLENNFPFFVPSDYKKHADGYRRFRSPDQLGLPLEKIPNASPGQYQLAKDVNQDYFAFTDKVMRMIGKRPESLAETARRMAENLCSYARERVDYVQDALKHTQTMRKHKRQCMSAGEYDTYSTPSRDKRLTRYFNILKDFTQKTNWKENEFGGKVYIENIFSENTSMNNKEMLKYCHIYYQPDSREKALNLRQIWQSIDNKTFISDPHANLQQRWGISKTTFKPNCKQY